MGIIIDLNNRFVSKEETEITIDNNKIFDDLLEGPFEETPEERLRDIKADNSVLLEDITINVDNFVNPNLITKEQIKDIKSLNETEIAIDNNFKNNHIIDKFMEIVEKNKIELFLFNAVPYSISRNEGRTAIDLINGDKTISDVVDKQLKNANLENAVSTAFNKYTMLSKIKYYTAKELAELAAANFYLERYVQISIKRGNSFLPTGDGRKFNGDIDLENNLSLKDFSLKDLLKLNLNPNVDLETKKKNVRKDITHYGAKTKYFDFQNNKIGEEKEIIFGTAKKSGVNESNTRIINLSKGNFKIKDDTAFDSAINSALQNRAFQKENTERQVGSLYVVPIKEGTGFENFYIPFEFNPIITESGMSAVYNAQTVMSRIGALQSYSGTNSNTITLSTTYYAMYGGEEIEENLSWMSEFSLKKIQAIELAYRSLTLPSFPDKETVEGYKYVKPPLVRVIMGNTEENSKIYNNLLTYGNTIYEGKLESITDGYDKKFKNFIVTNCVINKNMDAQPLYIDENNKTVLDTFGFEVTLNLTEVTVSYMDQTPDFRSYYDSYVKGV